MTSTHPRVGMTLLVGIGVKAKVWALARRGAHSFLAVRAVCRIVALCGCDFPFGCVCIGLYRFCIGLYQIISDCIGFKRVWSVLYRIYIGLYRVWSGLVGGSRPYSCHAHHAHFMPCICTYTYYI